MRHKKAGRKLGVVTKHRRAMLRNLATVLFKYGSIRTTDSRAKEVRRVAEKLVTMAKKGTLQHRRQAASYLKDKDVLKKLFSEVAEHHKDRPGGYTRIIKLGFRKGDGAPLSLIELVQEEYKSKPKPKPKKKAASAKAKSSSKKKEAVSEKSSKKESAKELGLAEGDTEVKDGAEVKDVQTTEPKKKPDPKADEAADKKVQEAVSEKSSEKESAKEPDLVKDSGEVKDETHAKSKEEKDSDAAEAEDKEVQEVSAEDQKVKAKDQVSEDAAEAEKEEAEPTAEVKSSEPEVTTEDETDEGSETDKSGKKDS